MVTRGATSGAAAQAGLCAVSTSAGAGALEQGRAGTAGAGRWKGGVGRAPCVWGDRREAGQGRRPCDAVTQSGWSHDGEGLWAGVRRLDFVSGSREDTTGFHRGVM